MVADVAPILCDSHLQVVEPRLHIRAKTLLCVFAGGKSVHRATPSSCASRWRNTRFAGGGLLRVQPSPMLLYTVSPPQLPDWLLLCVTRVTCPAKRIRRAVDLFAQL